MDSNIEKFAKRLNEALEMAESIMDGTNQAMVLSMKAINDAGERNLTPTYWRLSGEHEAATARWRALLDVQQMLADEVGVRVAAQSFAEGER